MQDKDFEDRLMSAERSMPSLQQSNIKSLGQKAILISGGLIALIALIAVNGGFSGSGKEKDVQDNLRKHKIINHLGDAPQMPLLSEKPIPAHIEPPQEILLTNQSHHNRQEEQTPEERKITSSIFEYQIKENNHVQNAEGFNQAIAEPPLKDALSKNLQPTALNGAKANLIPDRNLFITKGTLIDCVLETAISSDIPGMTACRIARDVYSTSGKIVLLERGTRVIGQYKGGIQHGQSRLFILWHRAETPHGVIIDLDSGGADALGRAGHEGFIDTHFFDRFSSAIMLSLIDDIGSYAVSQASNGQNGQFQLSGTAGSTSDTAGIALENSINIRPTFYKNQGDTMRIFIARDLDFRGVYDLELNN